MFRNVESPSVTKTKLMKNTTLKYLLLLLFWGIATGEMMAQSAGSSGSKSMYALYAVGALLLTGIWMQVSDKFIGKKSAGGAQDGSTVALQQGHDIILKGAPAKKQLSVNVKTYAVRPSDFKGLAPIPKMEVEVGAEVKAGDALFHDKAMPDVKFVAPVSGEVIAINRGAKRAIAEVVILADKEQQYRSLTPPQLNACSRQELQDFLMDSGAWALIRQRPFQIVPAQGDVPRDIFISTFDTAPLAPDLNYVVEGRGEAFQKGLDVLARLTDGSVWLGLDGRGQSAPSAVFAQAKGVKKCSFKGKHPAGNVGVQIHHIRPIGSGEKVWTLNVQDVITIGALFTEARFNASRVVAVSGDECKENGYVTTCIGANIGDLMSGNLKGENVRVISGDILSGTTTNAAGFLSPFDDQLTAVEEGNDFEVFGWLAPSYARPAVSRTYLSNLVAPGKSFHVNTNTHGERRAFVVTGQYEAVLPMDILPQHLFKAILAGDIEQMEGLGILELSEEDVALCEFACTSKQPLQQMLQDGLEMMQEQV
jgi:Na+-transporting NADH:ubiquinone oxidoreductase subunit A